MSRVSPHHVDITEGSVIKLGSFTPGGVKILQAGNKHRDSHVFPSIGAHLVPIACNQQTKNVQCGTEIMIRTIMTIWNIIAECRHQ